MAPVPATGFHDGREEGRDGTHAPQVQATTRQPEEQGQRNGKGHADGA